MILNIMFFIPYIIMILFGNFLNCFFKRQGLSIRTIDLLLVYFFIGIHVYSFNVFEISVLPHFLILLGVLGILFASILTFKKKQKLNRRFFVRFIRITDLLTLSLYTIIGIIFLLNK